MLDKRLNAVSGGSILIWIGITMLTEIGWGPGLVGVGIIIVLEQAARRAFNVKFDAFWIIIGSIFAVTGILFWIGIKVSLIPIVFIVVGVAVLASAIKSNKKG